MALCPHTPQTHAQVAHTCHACHRSDHTKRLQTCTGGVARSSVGGSRSSSRCPTTSRRGSSGGSCVKSHGAAWPNCPTGPPSMVHREMALESGPRPGGALRPGGGGLCGACLGGTCARRRCGGFPHILRRIWWQKEEGQIPLPLGARTLCFHRLLVGGGSILVLARHTALARPRGAAGRQDEAPLVEVLDAQHGGAVRPEVVPQRDAGPGQPGPQEGRRLGGGAGATQLLNDDSWGGAGGCTS